MRNLILFVVVCILFCGCDSRTPEEVRAINDSTLSSDGELVGTFQDGKELRRYKIHNEYIHDHWVYVVGDTVTVNSTVRHGKTTSNKVEVFTNGVKQ